MIRHASILLLNLDASAAIEAVRCTTLSALHFATFAVISFGTNAVLQISIRLEDCFRRKFYSLLTLTIVEAVEVALWNNTSFKLTMGTRQARGTVTWKFWTLFKIFLTSTPIHTEGMFSTSNVVAQHGVHMILGNTEDGLRMIDGEGGSCSS